MDIAKSSIKLFAAKISSAIIGFYGIVYFSQVLGASAMGTFFLFQALLGMLTIPADFGLRGAVEKRISEGDAQGVYITSAVLVKILPISLIVAGILILSSYINQYIGAPVAKFLAVGILLEEAARFGVAVLRGELRVGETAALRLVKQAVWVGLGIVLIKYGLEAEGLIYSLLAGMVLMFSWSWIKISVAVSMPSIEQMYSLLNYGKYNVVSSIGGYFYSWMDVAIIGLILTQTHVGAYENAWRITAISLLLSQSIASAIFPQISQWNAEQANEQIASVIRNTITPSILLVIPTFFGTLIFSREILNLLFGPEFTIAATALIILSAEKVLQSVHVIFGKALQGINRPDLAARATAISIFINLILNIILILSFGLIGAAVATTVSFIFNTVLHAYYLSNWVNIELPYHEIGWCIASAIGMATILYPIKTAISIDSLPWLFGSIFLGAVVYGGLVIIHPTIRERTIENVYQYRS